MTQNNIVVVINSNLETRRMHYPNDFIDQSLKVFKSANKREKSEDCLERRKNSYLTIVNLLDAPSFAMTKKIYLTLSFNPNFHEWMFLLVYLCLCLSTHSARLDDEWWITADKACHV